MRSRSITQFLRVLEDHAERAEILSEFESLLVHLNFEFYGIFGKLELGTDHLKGAIAGHWPKDWIETYSKKKFAAVDPTFRYLTVSSQGYRWANTLKFFAKDPNHRKMARMMAEAARFGIEDGYTFPVFGRSGLTGFLCVAGQVQSFSETEIALLDAVSKKILEKLQALKKPDVRDSDIGTQNTTSITRRELQTLKYIAEGMTSNDISKLMEISNHTVDWYMNGLQEKLNARNRQHAVAIALRTGLIS